MRTSAEWLAELEEEMRRGSIVECSLRDVGWHLDGMQSGQTVYIDPRPAVLETLLHELTHRRYPSMGERAVTRTARKLVGSMDEQTKARWYRAYNRTKRKARPVEVE
jgi:hypothetical protein